MVKYYDPQIYGDSPIGAVDEYDGRLYVCISDYAALESRVAGLERDAARYRWLKENHNADLLAEDVIDEALEESK